MVALFHKVFKDPISSRFLLHRPLSSWFRMELPSSHSGPNQQDEVHIVYLSLKVPPKVATRHFSCIPLNLVTWPHLAPGETSSFVLGALVSS